MNDNIIVTSMIPVLYCALRSKFWMDYPPRIPGDIPPGVPVRLYVWELELDKLPVS